MGCKRTLIIIYGISLVIATQLSLVYAGCAITPDANGHVTIPDGVKSIRKGAFYKCTTLISVSIPDSVTHLGNHSFQQSALQSVSIPASVLDIGYGAFAFCNKLQSVRIKVSSTQ